MNEWVKNFLTLGLTSEQTKGFTIGTYRLAIVALLGFAYAGFLGFDGAGFALASDVKTQITSNQTTIAKDLAAVKSEVADATRLLNKQLAAGIASQIRAAAAKRCPPSSVRDREVANAEIDRLQVEYQDIVGREYRIPECGVL